MVRENRPPGRALAATRFTERQLGLSLLAAAMVASAVALLWIGRGQTIHGDELEYATRLATQGLGHTLLHTPPTRYLIAVPLLIYHTIFVVFGLGSYFVHRGVAVAFALLCAGLLYELARRRVGYLLALPPTVLLLFFGSGWEVILTPLRLPSLIAIACGLGALLALEKRELAWDAVAALLLCAAVASHPTGLAFSAAAALLILLSSAPRWRRLWVFVAPAVVFGAWYLIWRTPAPSEYTNSFSDVFLFVCQSWVMMGATLTGLSGVLSTPVYEQPIAQALGGFMFVVVVVVVAARFRQISPLFWAALGGFAVLTVTTRVAHAGGLSTPDQPRYVYPEAVLFLLVFAALAEPFRLPRWTQWMAVIAITLGFAANFDKLLDGGRASRDASQATLGRLSGLQLAGPNLRPEYSPALFEPTAGLDVAAMRRFGSPALSASELMSAQDDVRRIADRALAGALGVTVTPTSVSAERAGPPPKVVRELNGDAVRKTGCIDVSPTKPAGERPVGLAILSLPPGGASLAARGPADVRLLLGKFTTPSVPLRRVSGHGALLETPHDESGIPWKLRIRADQRVTVCGLSGPRP